MFIVIIIIIIYTINVVLNARKKTIQQYATAIASAVENVNDPNTLDRVIALMTQASVSLKAAKDSDDKQVNAFVKKDQFAPTQKNETQLRFKITTKPPGRKKQHLPMR